MRTALGHLESRRSRMRRPSGGCLELVTLAGDSADKQRGTREALQSNLASVLGTRPTALSPNAPEVI